ncbi:MAG: right-handed parallel beta-helix repeat-containing protein, partial [Planctomycetota bacterium]
IATLRNVIVSYAGQGQDAVRTTINTEASMDGVRVEHSGSVGFSFFPTAPQPANRLTAYRCATAGIFVNGTNGLTLRQCTFVDNASSFSTQNNGAVNLVTDSIFWNSPPSGAAVGELRYCQGVTTGTGVGNDLSDPQFVDLAQGDLRLASGSPCINTGDPLSPLDPDSTRADRGAYPSSGCEPTFFCPQPAIGGCEPTLGTSGGLASLTAPGRFDLILDGGPDNTFAIFFYSTAPAASAATPFGTRCTGASIVRTMAVPSGGNRLAGPCTGAFSFDFNAWLQSGADPVLSGGDAVIGQFWFRDGNAPAGSRFSSAVQFEICP